MFFVLFLISASFAATFTDDLTKIGVGARPMGMGKAFVSVADGVDGIFSNPAGTSLSKSFEFTSMYTSMFEGDLNYVVLGMTNPFKFATLGFGMIATGTSQIPAPSPTTITYFDYYDRLFLLSLAGREPLDLKGNKLYYGANLKYFTKGFSDPVQKTAAGINADLGARLDAANGTSLGLCLNNILPSQLIWNTGAAEDMPSTAKIGLSRRFFSEKLLLALSADVSLKRSLPTPLHLGAEYYFNEYLTARAGVDQNISAGSGVVSNLTAGIGINIRQLRLDYAFHPYSEGAMPTAHFVSISFK